MKKLISVPTLIFLTCLLNAQSVIHVKDKQTIDIEGIGSIRGYGGFVGMSHYLNNNTFLQFGLHYENASLKYSKDHELLVPININYSLLSYRTFYFNLRGGVFGGMELLRSSVEDNKINNFTFGFLMGPNFEYWPNPHIGIVWGVDQWLKFHTEVGHKIVANVGIKISLN